MRPAAARAISAFPDPSITVSTGIATAAEPLSANLFDELVEQADQPCTGRRVAGAAARWSGVGEHRVTGG